MQKPPRCFVRNEHQQLGSSHHRFPTVICLREILSLRTLMDRQSFIIFNVPFLDERCEHSYGLINLLMTKYNSFFKENFYRQKVVDYPFVHIFTCYGISGTSYRKEYSYLTQKFYSLQSKLRMGKIRVLITVNMFLIFNMQLKFYSHFCYYLSSLALALSQQDPQPQHLQFF